MTTTVTLPKIGGTFIYCRACKFRTRNMSKFRRHWRNLHATDKDFFLLQCLVCDRASRPLPLPFDTEEERGKWAAEHRQGTGHDEWRVTDIRH